MPKPNKAERLALQELERRNAEMQLTARKPVDRTELGFDKQLSDWQRQVIHDPSKRIHLCMGRRSGKSTCCAIMALRVVLSREDALVFIILPSRDRARTTYWSTFKRLTSSYRLKAVYNESDLSIRFNTKSTIRLLGVEDVYHADRLRGTPADLYIVDECQSFRDKTLRYLIDECIDPASGDLDAPIVLAGTPSNTTTGLWFESDKRNNPSTSFSCYTTTVLSNSYFERWRGNENWEQQAATYLANERKKKGWSETNPIFLREWLASWQTDSTSFYYHEFNTAKNVVPRAEIPDGLTYVIAGDFGSRVDPTALCVLGYNEHLNKNCYVVDCLKIESPTRAENICFQLHKLIEKYAPERVVGDYAAGGTYIFDQMSERYGVLVDDAQKKKKSGATDVINSELFESRIKIADDLAELIGELKTIHWDDARKGPLPSDPNDCADAFQYGFTEVYSYLFKPPAPKKTHAELVKQELDEYWAEQDRKMDEEAEYWNLLR